MQHASKRTASEGCKVCCGKAGHRWSYTLEKTVECKRRAVTSRSPSGAPPPPHAGHAAAGARTGGAAPRASGGRAAPNAHCETQSGKAWICVWMFSRFRLGSRLGTSKPGSPACRSVAPPLCSWASMRVGRPAATATRASSTSAQPAGRARGQAGWRPAGLRRGSVGAAVACCWHVSLKRGSCAAPARPGARSKRAALLAPTGQPRPAAGLLGTRAAAYASARKRKPQRRRQPKRALGPPPRKPSTVQLQRIQRAPRV